MAISKYRAALFLAGLAAVGCGIVDDPPPPAEQAAVESDATGTPVDGLRKSALITTHARVTQLFINQPSFGGDRMLREYHVDADVVRSASSISRQPDNAVHRFQPPARVKDTPPHAPFQKQAAGMATSPWSETETFEPWEMRTVQLIGLVKHPGPVAYETDEVTMPRGVGEIPTRAVDAFEMRGLKKLREGDDLYAETIPGQKARALGPIYAGAKCISCHANQGELLGAFSYTYDIDKPVGPQAGAPVPPQP